MAEQIFTEKIEDNVIVQRYWDTFRPASTSDQRRRSWRRFWRTRLRNIGRTVTPRIVLAKSDFTKSSNGSCVRGMAGFSLSKMYANFSGSTRTMYAMNCGKIKGKGESQSESKGLANKQHKQKTHRSI
jgi:hypothetical protein